MTVARLLLCVSFFFNDTATTEIYTLSLHDALPISGPRGARGRTPPGRGLAPGEPRPGLLRLPPPGPLGLRLLHLVPRLQGQPPPDRPPRHRPRPRDHRRGRLR